MAIYGRVVRRSAALTGVVAAVMVALCAGLIGAKGLYGALIGIGVVTAFFGISVLVVGRAARISPQVMMATAMVTYVVKIIALAVIISAMNGTTAFSTRATGFVAIGCILVWSATQVITTMKLKVLYVEPDQQPQKQTAQRGG